MNTLYGGLRDCHLATRTSVMSANHSFNGIIFDLEVTSIEDIRVESFEVSGSLGAMTVWIKRGASCREGYQEQSEWELAADVHLEASWRELTTLPLDPPIVFTAGTLNAIYIHSAGRDDRGLLYQSYPAVQQPFCQDSNIRCYPGFARIGFQPFMTDAEENPRVRGWHRGGRGFAGVINYTPERLVWDFSNHAEFPADFRHIIVTLFCCWQKEHCILGVLPMECFCHVLSFLDWRAFPLRKPGLLRRLSSGIKSLTSPKK